MIGTVDSGVLIEKSVMGLLARTKWELERPEYADRLSARRAKIADLSDRAHAARVFEARTALEEELRAEVADASRLAEEGNAREAELRAPLLVAIAASVAAVARARGLSLVLDRQRSMLWHVDSAVDITADVLAHMNGGEEQAPAQTETLDEMTSRFSEAVTPAIDDIVRLAGEGDLEKVREGAKILAAGTRVLGHQEAMNSLAAGSLTAADVRRTLPAQEPPSTEKADDDGLKTGLYL